MRLVWLELHGYRRFEHSKANLDARVVALVGPNESGKSSLLQSLSSVYHSGEFDSRDFTRGLTPSGPTLEATFLLEKEDLTALSDAVPEAREVKWYCIGRTRDGEPYQETIPVVDWAGTAARRARSTLTKLRSLKWINTLAEDVLSLLDDALSHLGDADTAREYSEHEIELLKQLEQVLALQAEDKAPATLQKAREHLALMIENEMRIRPQQLALDHLHSQRPEILNFSESDRTLHTNHNLHDPSTWTNGLRNLARLAGMNLQALAQATDGARPEVREEILRDANRRLSRTFDVRWSQSKLEVHLSAQGNILEVYVATNNGGLHRLEDRSDGLRTYLALIAFLDHQDPNRSPILLIDEAESHLHWDAQADLINVLYEQQLASQVIYSTHSPGCLPHDLGNSVRAVTPTAPDRSEVTNWVWSTRAGFRPLLTYMGASMAALTPHRYAIVTEGVADFILLPSLLRAAIDKDSLPFQVVTGLAQVSASGLRSLDSESDALAYVVDGDAGGAKLKSWLASQGIPEARIFALPKKVALEDLVHGEALSSAILEEIRRSGNSVETALNLPATERNSYLKRWYARAGVEPPSKRAIASRVLELTARAPSREALPLLESIHTATLRRLYGSLVEILGVATSPPD